MRIAIFAGSFKPPHKGHLFLIEKLLKKQHLDKIYIIISPKSRDTITSSQSIAIWNLYIKSLKEQYSDKIKKVDIKVLISNISSPILMAYNIAKSLGKNDELLLIKSSKDDENSRYDIIKKLANENGFKVKEIVLPQLKHLNATNMRKAIESKDKKIFEQFIPDDVNVNRIWNIVK